MKRTLACLATLTLLASAPAAKAETADPIGDLISKALSVIGSPALKLKATLYHAGAKGVGGRDSLGCAVSPMRTLAVDPGYIPKRTIGNLAGGGATPAMVRSCSSRRLRWVLDSAPGGRTPPLDHALLRGCCRPW